MKMYMVSLFIYQIITSVLVNSIIPLDCIMSYIDDLIGCQ